MGGDDLMPASVQVASLRRALLRWYRLHGRELPWRHKGAGQPDAYHVLVSEAMLQQTQVATVIPYFERFIAAWPTVQALAAADEQQVLRAWQGLGYYRRARLLHAAAGKIVADFDGHVPDRVELLLTLPGVGRYTAGAIASIAFGRSEPILDGNVARVLARWFAIDNPIDATATRSRLWRLAGQMAPPRTAGDFNQAMMDLGAMVCLPRNPTCHQCPVARLCRAHVEQKVHVLPVTTARRTPKRVTHHIVAIHRRGQHLFQQRPQQGLWATMWQMPTAEQFTVRINDRQVRRWVEQQFGLMIAPPHRVGTFNHQTTHRAICFVIWQAQAIAGRLRRGSGQWRTLEKIGELPLANPQRRAMKMLECHPGAVTVRR